MPAKNYDVKLGSEAVIKTQKSKREKAGSGAFFSDFARQLVEVSNTVSKHQLEELRAILHKAHSRRFKQRSEPKYGSVSKAFSELELQHFLRNVKDDKFRLLFKYQAYLGLRVGEVCKLHVSNIDFGKRELTIRSEKSGKLASLLIPLDLFRETTEFIKKNLSAVKEAEGYIFFKENDNNHNNILYVDLGYTRKVFRESVHRAGLAQIYAYSEETDPTHNERPLYRLTTHSLRHYAITKFAKNTNGNVVLTSRFARHSNPNVTMRYISKDNEELYSNIDAVFSSQIESGIRRLRSEHS